MHLINSTGFNHSITTVSLNLLLFLKAENMTLTLMCFSLDPSSCCNMNQKGKQLSRPSITVLLVSLLSTLI